MEIPMHFLGRRHGAGARGRGVRWRSLGHPCRLRPNQRAPEHRRRADRRPALGHAFGNACRRAEARRARGHVQEQLRGQLEPAARAAPAC